MVGIEVGVKVVGARVGDDVELVGIEVGVIVVGARVGNDVDGVDDGTSVIGACDGAGDGGHVFVDNDPPPGHTQHASVAGIPPAPMKLPNAEQSLVLNKANQPSMSVQVIVSSWPATETETCHGTPHSGPMLKQAAGAGVSPGRDGASVGVGVGAGVGASEVDRQCLSGFGWAPGSGR